MRKLRNVALIIVVAVALLVATACDGAKHPPETGVIQYSGDSVLWQSGMYGGDFHGADQFELIGIGWEARHAQPRATENVYGNGDPVGHSPEVFAMAFGQNYADVYGQNESSQLFSLMFLPHAATCVVVVLPAVSQTPPAGYSQANVNAVRTDLVTLANARNNQGSPTVVVDWQEVVQSQWLEPDGIHLENTDGVPTANGQAGAVALADLVWEGVQECP